jgi:hypothetical protein
MDGADGIDHTGEPDVMLVFPQLTSGAIGQLPIVRRRRYIAPINVLGDGSSITYPDLTPRTNFWELTLRDLSDPEADSIRQLFQLAEGRRGAFTFLDPTANLFAYSEELEGTCWSKDPLLQLTPGVADPLGGLRAIRMINTGQDLQSLTQTLDGPGWFNFCFSVYGRSSGSSELSLCRSSSSNIHAGVFPLGAAWTRCALSGALTGETIQFALQLPAGASVDLFGIQAEAQPSASGYKQSRARGGVYSNARFDEDTLRQTCDGPDQHGFNLRIVAKD